MAKARSTLGVLARASPEPDQTLVVLSCMDLPLGDSIADALEARYFTRRFDHLTLGGASLGAVTTRFPHWGRTFYEHLAFARALHGVSRVVLVDHRDCSVYERLLSLGLGVDGDEARERDVHLAHQQKLRRKIHALDHTIEVDCWLLDHAGKAEDLSDVADLWLPGITERRRKPRGERKGRAPRKVRSRLARARR